MHGNCTHVVMNAAPVASFGPAFRLSLEVKILERIPVKGIN